MPGPAGTENRPHGGGGQSGGPGGRRGGQERSGQKIRRENNGHGLAGPEKMPGDRVRPAAPPYIQSRLRSGERRLPGLFGLCGTRLHRRVLPGHDGHAGLLRHDRPGTGGQHPKADPGGDRDHRLRWRVLQQGVRQDGIGLQKAGRHHRHHPGQLPGNPLAPAGFRSALCRKGVRENPERQRYPDDRRPGPTAEGARRQPPGQGRRYALGGRMPTAWTTNRSASGATCRRSSPFPTA